MEGQREGRIFHPNGFVFDWYSDFSIEVFPDAYLRTSPSAVEAHKHLTIESSTKLGTKIDHWVEKQSEQSKTERILVHSIKHNLNKTAATFEQLTSLGSLG